MPTYVNSSYMLGRRWMRIPWEFFWIRVYASRNDSAPKLEVCDHVAVKNKNKKKQKMK